MAAWADAHTEHLVKLKNADEQKFIEFLFKSFYSPLCKAVYKIVRDTDACEDIVQEVFYKVWRNRDALDLSKSVKSYLYRSAINTALNYLEKQKRNVELDENEVIGTKLSANTTEDILNSSELEQKINSAINELPSRCKTVFMMSRFEEMSYQEIADTLEVTVKAVEKQMSKALQILREALKMYVNHMILVIFWIFY
jgi:RNA polymerase sigma-70 factor (ECF subfamily)